MIFTITNAIFYVFFYLDSKMKVEIDWLSDRTQFIKKRMILTAWYGLLPYFLWASQIGLLATNLTTNQVLYFVTFESCQYSFGCLNTQNYSCFLRLI